MSDTFDHEADAWDDSLFNSERYDADDAAWVGGKGYRRRSGGYSSYNGPTPGYAGFSSDPWVFCNHCLGRCKWMNDGSKWRLYDNDVQMHLCDGLKKTLPKCRDCGKVCVWKKTSDGWKLFGMKGKAHACKEDPMLKLAKKQEYRVELNKCKCRPELCACAPFKIVDPDGKAVGFTVMDRAIAERVAELMTKSAS